MIFHPLGSFCRIFAEFHGFICLFFWKGVWSGLDSRLSFSIFFFARFGGKFSGFLLWLHIS